MTTLFDIGFEDQRFIPDIQNMGNFVGMTGGTIEISAAAALVGSYGMAVTPRTGGSVSNYSNWAFLCRYVGRQSRFRQRFYFDPNSISVSNGKYVHIAKGGNYSDPRYVVFMYYSSGYYIQMDCYTDSGGTASSANYSMGDQPRYIEVDWKASDGPGLNNGYMNLWINGVHQGSSPTVSGVDNDTKRVYHPQLGCCYGHSATVSGTMYFDGWKANDDGSAIGA